MYFTSCAAVGTVPADSPHSGSVWEDERRLWQHAPEKPDSPPRGRAYLPSLPPLEPCVCRSLTSKYIHDRFSKCRDSIQAKPSACFSLPQQAMFWERFVRQSNSTTSMCVIVYGSVLVCPRKFYTMTCSVGCSLSLHAVPQDQLTGAGVGGGEMNVVRERGPPRVMPVTVPVTQSPGTVNTQIAQVEQLCTYKRSYLCTYSVTGVNDGYSLNPESCRYFY